MEITVKLTEEQCAAVLKLLNACGPLNTTATVFQSPAARARYEAATIMLWEWHHQSQKSEEMLMNEIESLEEV